MYLALPSMGPPIILRPDNLSQLRRAELAVPLSHAYRSAMLAPHLGMSLLHPGMSAGATLDSLAVCAPPASPSACLK